MSTDVLRDTRERGAALIQQLLWVFGPQAGPKVRLTVSGLCGLLAVVSNAIGLAYSGPDGLGAAATGVMLLLMSGSYLLGGMRAVLTSVKSARQRRPDVNLLMVVAALGAAVTGHWNEGAVLFFLFSLSDALENYAIERTRRSVSSLMKLRPDQACVVRDGRELTVPLEQLATGDHIRVRPGERFAIDGEVVEGTAAVDESIVTGEPLPVEKTPGSPIYAGTINTNGSLVVVMTKPATESTIAKIVHLVEQAQERKAPVQRLIEKWEAPFVIAVLGMALLTLLWTLIQTGNFPLALYTSMVILVAASPCAVVLASPVAVLATVTCGARHGILFKGGSHIERLATVARVAFDKTGTLTDGKPSLASIKSVSGEEDDILRIAAALEDHSKHPLAEALVQAARDRELVLPEVSDFVNKPGLGICGHINGRWVGAGRPELFERHGVEIPKSVAEAGNNTTAGTLVIVAEQGGRAAAFTFTDRIRPHAASCVKRLRRGGIGEIVLLTGDRAEPARRVAEALGIKDVRAGLLPEDKMQAVALMTKEPQGVAMVGDGVNDAPALAAASVGIAMGAAGTDVALETADVVLMRDDLNHLPRALQLSRRCRAVIQQSLLFAFGVIIVLVICTLVLPKSLPLAIAVLGHEGSSVLVVLNGLRLLHETDTPGTAVHKNS